MTPLTTIILAAGEGTRMKSKQPKVLHEVGGMPIVGHVLRAAVAAGSNKIAMVTGPGHETVQHVMSNIHPDLEFYTQTERRGTAHAASMARETFAHATGYIAVCYGDHPLLRAENYAAIIAKLDTGADAVVLGFDAIDPTGYGRLITDGEKLLAIREHKDASELERKITLSNACILAFKADVFNALIDKVGNSNAQGEYYLTDLVELAVAQDKNVTFVIAPEQDVMGVNDRVQLSKAETVFQNRKREEAMRNGATLLDPSSVYFSFDTVIGQDVLIEQNVVFGKGVTIASDTIIHAFSHLEGTTVESGASVGPYARLRPGAYLEQNSRVGNFVEVKNARIHRGAKVNHLSYIGDAKVGEGSNIGAGTITGNYDGYNKHKTTIGKNAFIGSNTVLVAPVSIGDNAFVVAGSTITKDVEPDALGIGRARQNNKLGYGKTIKDKLAAEKSAKSKP